MKRALLSTCLAAAVALPAWAEEGDYVSREEYEKLKREFERMKALVERLEQKLQGAKQPAMTELERRVERALQESRKAKEQARSLLPGGRKFLLTGYGFANFVDPEQGDSHFSAGFNPLFLWKIYDKVFFEGEAEFELEDGQTNVKLEFAQLSYLLNDYMTLGVGKFLNPTNYFMERLHNPWINKLPDKPLSIAGPNFIQAKTLVGGQVRGAIPLRLLGFDPFGGGRIGYALYVANGAKMGRDGSFDFNNFESLDSNKQVGGRVGLVPWPGFEVGYGFELGRVEDAFSNRDLDVTTHVVDFNYVQTSRAILGRIDLRAQWAWRDSDRSRGLGFDNKVRGGYGQVAYRPMLAGVDLIPNLEGVFRFDRLNQPDSSPFFDENRYTVGLNYYFNPATVFKFAYQFDDRRGARDNDTLMVQVATGF